jgi:hypothetical protein
VATFYVLMILIGTTKGYQWRPTLVDFAKEQCEALATPEKLEQWRGKTPVLKWRCEPFSYRLKPSRAEGIAATKAWEADLASHKNQEK